MELYSLLSAGTLEGPTYSISLVGAEAATVDVRLMVKVAWAISNAKKIVPRNVFLDISFSLFLYMCLNVQLLCFNVLSYLVS